MNSKVIITTSGTATRLGLLTKHTNHALVRIGKKPAISYIIEAYPANTTFVITLGHFGEQVREFLSLAYPKHDFEFVEVDTYTGPGSSLGYSMLCAKEKLQCPFIYHASDTIIPHIKNPQNQNWIAIHPGKETAQYNSIKIKNGKLQTIQSKGAANFDGIYMGIAGVHDYQSFWKILSKEHQKNPQNPLLNDSLVINAMTEGGNMFTPVEYDTWYDIGNTETLEHARKQIPDHFDNLDKADESIYFFENSVIKFFADEKIAKQRVARAKILKGLVPSIKKSGKHFYEYTYAQGNLYADVVTPADFQEFLRWTKQKLWKKKSEVSPAEFRKICADFYITKTKERIQKFFDSTGLEDQKHIINGEAVPTLKAMLDMLDTNWLTRSEQYMFHGDFILDNIIKTKKGYCLLDWRQNFGGLLKAGDRYYDLAKLNHNLTINHDIVHRNLFTVTEKENIITCDILRKDNLVACQQVLHDFIKKEKMDLEKVKTLTSIVWLNMAPLHHHPFNRFLYYYGKLNLWHTLKK